MGDVECLKPIFKAKPTAVANAYGGKVPDTSICEKGWAAAPKKYCVASRGGGHLNTQFGLGKVCDKLGEMGHSCGKNIPKSCENDDYGKADWAFSMFYEMEKTRIVKSGGKLQDACNWNGSFISPVPLRPGCTLTSVPAAPTKPPTKGPTPPPGSP